MKGQLDWQRRYQLMRTHTALHILCGVVFRDYGAQVTGGDMEPLQGRMDFEFESLRKDLVRVIEAAVNAEVAAARPVRVQILPRETAFQIPDLIRTKINLLPEGHQRGAHRRDRRAGPAGRRRHARAQHGRGGPHPRGGLQEQGQDQQTHLHRNGCGLTGLRVAAQQRIQVSTRGNRGRRQSPFFDRFWVFYSDASIRIKHPNTYFAYTSLSAAGAGRSARFRPP